MKKPTKEQLEKWAKQGRPLSFDDPNIKRGSGIQSDHPTGLPVGSLHLGKHICGARTADDIPCIIKPMQSGRCHRHSQLPKEDKKKTVTDTYKSVLDRKEQRLYITAQIKTLEQEIRISKTLLRRVIEVFNAEDKDSVNNYTKMVIAIKDLEAEHNRLMGGVTDTVVTLVEEMREVCSNMDGMMSSDTSPEE